LTNVPLVEPRSLTDSGVSRRHAQLVTGEDGTAVSDLGSTNGTFVNGAPAGRTPLRDGDRITIGTTELVYRSGR
jgi:pSer/pThr/pTyr-binding forkhead associated (FHA) protein